MKMPYKECATCPYWYGSGKANYMECHFEELTSEDEVPPCEEKELEKFA